MPFFTICDYYNNEFISNVLVMFWYVGFSYFSGLPSFNTQTAKYVYLRFSSIVWFLQFLSLWVLEDRSKLILFYTKFWVNRARLLAAFCCQYTEITGIFLRFQTEECVLRVKENCFLARF